MLEKFREFYGRHTQRITFLIILLILWTLFSLFIPRFFSYANFFNLARRTAIVGIVSIGMTIVLISQGVDLSVGSYVAVSGVLVGSFLTGARGFPELPIPLAILATILVLSFLGFIVGFSIHDLKVPSFVAGLGMMSIARGLAMVLSGGRIITGLPREFTGFARMEFLGMPALFIVLLVILLGGGFLMSRTKFGRNVYTMGSSKEVARLSGINLRINTYAIYILNAILSAIAGMLLAARLSSGIPSEGVMMELDAIAASIIGGTGLSGGEGSVYGTLMGAFLIGSLQNAGNLMGLDPFYLQIVTGVVIIVAVALDQMRSQQEA